MIKIFIVSLYFIKIYIMKTHFYIHYFGKKRKEMTNLYPYLVFTNINTIIEPYADSCDISFYIAQERSGLTYILNYNNP